MTRTARRRWSREVDGVIDGIALGGSGPVLVHGYDPPAGGKWIDSVIPGRLAAHDRRSGDVLWISPCEVGYGRGFGAGLGPEDDVVVLGPGLRGHRIVRMTLPTGELVAAQEIQPFDQALVFPDLCFAVTPGRVTGIHTPALLEIWAFAREGERYHLMARSGDRLFVVFTDRREKRQGVLALDAADGEFAGEIVPPEVGVVHDFAADEGIAVLLAGTSPGLRSGDLRLIGVDAGGPSEGRVLWVEGLPSEAEELPEVSIRMDGGKVYVARGALLEVRDALSGRLLGDLTVPGLDEHVAWKVAHGAGLLAEETRVSVFEIPE